MKYRGSHFEMPTAEFGHFDILKREIEGQKTKFEVPKSQFEVLGAKTQSDFVNLPPKNNEVDIPYVLHKRHIMNGTATKEETTKIKPKEPVKVKEPTSSTSSSSKGVQEVPDIGEQKKSKPISPVAAEPEKTFLFTQNIDETDQSRSCGAGEDVPIHAEHRFIQGGSGHLGDRQEREADSTHFES
ncbi:hypothetical protein QE152_g4192 [Popillia japonica]|uniref:Uncharacterized protein n=1 Tax=Popillia japonica TaxID=7064 RepID=A0AAW1N361_POPJA